MFEKSSFEGDQSNDSVEKRVRNDFRSSFALCAQARTCEKLVKTRGFCRFRGCRVVFAQVALLVRRSIEKTSKSTLRGSQNRPKIDQDRSSEPFSTHFDRLSRARTPQRDPKAAKTDPRSSKGDSRGLNGDSGADPVGTPWAGSVQWRRPAEEGGGGKPPLELVQELVRLSNTRPGAADLGATPSFHRPP